uniref:BCAS3 WD40 domain-containing protein n=1 Tax=Manihot esculenta TaxID=3983 RepID=A0A2C9ULC0_MANES
MLASLKTSEIGVRLPSGLTGIERVVRHDSQLGNFRRKEVHWTGFDKLEDEGDVIQRVLLLGCQSGFQVWDVEEADNVRNLVSRRDGPVSFLQMIPKPIASKRSADKFADNRPLLVVCIDVTLSGGSTFQDGLTIPQNGSTPDPHDLGNASFVPTIVQFYSLRSQFYIHMLKLRSTVYSVRCSSRIVAISQAAQIHCFDVATLEREYTILTNPIVTGYPCSGDTIYGPLAVGPRWLAYSGSPIAVSNSGRVSPQHLTPSTSFSGSNSNGSLVAHYAKESSKQLAAGIVTLGDMGYKKLDIVSKCVIAQFRAHTSPISVLCFDPSGTLLITASVHGHNINHCHSDDNNWIVISSSRGTNHLFAINPFGGSVNFQTSDASHTSKNSGLGVMMKSSIRWPPNLGLQMHEQQSICAPGPPDTLSVISRIRNESNCWRDTVTGAAVAAQKRPAKISKISRSKNGRRRSQRSPGAKNSRRRSQRSPGAKNDRRDPQDLPEQQRPGSPKIFWRHMLTVNSEIKESESDLSKELESQANKTLI